MPTLSESGLKGYEVRVWYALPAPAGTPGEVAGKLDTEIEKVMATPEVKDKLD